MRWTLDRCRKREEKRAKRAKQQKGHSSVRLSQSRLLSLTLSLHHLFSLGVDVSSVHSPHKHNTFTEHSWDSPCTPNNGINGLQLLTTATRSELAHTSIIFFFFLLPSPESLNEHFKATSEVNQFHIKALPYSSWNHPATHSQSFASATNPNKPTNQTKMKCFIVVALFALIAVAAAQYGGYG